MELMPFFTYHGAGKKTSVCDKMFKTVLEEKYELYRKRERVF